MSWHDDFLVRQLERRREALTTAGLTIETLQDTMDDLRPTREQLKTFYQVVLWLAWNTNWTKLREATDGA